MEFRILGPLEVVDGERLLDLGGPKQRAVLAALLVHVNHVVPLDRFIEDLWNGEPPPRATASLQAYISNLRRTLEPHRAPRNPPQVLLTRTPGYLLRVNAQALDAARFEAGAAEGRRWLDEGRPGAARQRLDDALALWRGPALAEVASQDFARAEANRLEELRLVAVEDRLQAALDLGDQGAAVAELERLVAAHPLRERLWGLLMIALYRSGRQADALRAYQAARRMLAEELGIDPGPALRRLEADVLAQAPSLEWRRRDERPAGAAGGGAAARSFGRPPIDSPRRSWPLVGRAREMAVLEQALAAATSGEGRAVLVRGEAGIGKTRLAEELIDRAAARGFLTASGSGYEGGGTPAFWPWVGVVRSLLEAGDLATLQNALERPAATIAQVVPEVKEVLGSLGTVPAVDPETNRFLFLEAVVEFLRRLAAHRPVVVVLDDLQWADVASLQLLGFLAAHLRNSALLVLGTYRPAEVALAHPLHEALAALARHQVVERVELAGLEEEATGALVVAATGAPVDGALAAAVQARTEGNPFFVVELVRLLQAEHGLDAGVAAHVVPAGVRDVVRRRLARLPDETVTLLALAAVAGREFELPVVAAAASVDLERALELAEAGVMSGLVVELGDGLEPYRFSHDLIRETILADLSGARRARLHARLGQALDAVLADDDVRVVEVADHLFRGAGLVDPVRAVTCAVRACDVAMARVAHEQAEEQARRALELLERLPAGDDRDRWELEVLLRLSFLIMMTSGYAAPKTGAVLQRARALCERMGESRRLVAVLWRLRTFDIVRGDLNVASHLDQQLLEVASASGETTDLFAAHQAAGVSATQAGDLAAARDHLEQALALPGVLDDQWLRSWMPQHPAVAAWTFLALVEALSGDARRAQELARRATATAERVDHSFSAVHALFFEAWIAVLDGDFPLARARAAALVELARSRGFALYAAMGSMLHGRARAAQGDAVAGSEEIRAGLEAMHATGARMLQGVFLAMLAETELAAGRPDAAMAAVERGLDSVLRSGERVYEAELRRLRGELLARIPGGSSEAVKELQAAVGVATAQGAGALARRAFESLRQAEAFATG